MASTVKEGSFYYRINPDNPAELQRQGGSCGNSWSRVWCFSGHKILDLSVSGSNIVISTTNGTYIRNHQGNVTKK